MARLVLTDASPLIGLAIVDGLPWLKALFGKVWMPPEVRDEVLLGPVSRGQAAINSTMKSGGLVVWPASVAGPDLAQLDEGEASCIRIALAQRRDALLLIDERAGRAIAQEHGLKVAGTAALIGMTRQRGLIASARTAFEILHNSDFRISAEVIRAVLTRVGET